uniref:Secreted protein n=1 Tax=Macrostomum lignano TaxID=282301 RepID=A0A1I8J1H1_9PLAT
MTMNTLMLISLVSPIKPRQWAKINCWTFSASLSSLPSSSRRRQLLQQITPASQSSIQPSPRRRRHLQQVAPGD